MYCTVMYCTVLYCTVARDGKPDLEKPQLKAVTTDLTTTKQSELLKAVTKVDKIVLKEAPPEYEFIADPPSISGTVLYSTVLYSTVLYSTVLYSTVTYIS